MKSELCELLGIEFPLFAFSHCRDVVAAVSQAGGFGVLGALAFSPEQLEIELKWIDEHIGGKPYGVDVVMPASYKPGESGEFAKDQLEPFALVATSPRSPTTTRRPTVDVAAARTQRAWLPPAGSQLAAPLIDS